MNRKIENADQLREEILRLKSLTKEKEEKIRQDLRQMKEQLKPANILMDTLSSLTGIEINKKEFLKNGIAIGLSMLFQRFIFKTETQVERKIYSWIDEIFDKVKNLVNKFSSAGAVRAEKIEKDEDEN